MAGDTNDLLQLPSEYSNSLYNAAIGIHNGAVKPITMIVLAIIAVLSLASTSMRTEGDRELGVRIIAATMFKLALMFVVIDHSNELLEAISSIANSIAKQADKIEIKDASGAATGAGGGLGDHFRAKINDAGITDRLTVIIFLMVPYMVTIAATAVVKVLLYVRFLQIYLLTSFSSLPVVFMGHDETKSMGIGYLKGFASVALSGTVTVIAIKLYQNLVVSKGIYAMKGTEGELVAFVGDNLPNFIIGPIVLVFMVLGANGMAKKLVGE